MELVCREALIRKVIKRRLQSDTAQHLMRHRVFGLDVMHIAHRDDFAAILLCKLHVKFIDTLLLLNPIIANRNVQVVVVKNLVQAVHIFDRYRISPSSHILTITAKEVPSNGNNAFLKLVDRLKRHGRNFSPTVTIFVTVTHNAKQIVIALFVLDQKREAFKCRRIFLACARRIHVNMAAINRLDRRESLLLTFLVQILSTSLDFQNTKHRTVVRQRHRRCIFRSRSRQNSIKSGRSLQNRKFRMSL